MDRAILEERGSAVGCWYVEESLSIKTESFLTGNPSSARRHYAITGEGRDPVHGLSKIGKGLVFLVHVEELLGEENQGDGKTNHCRDQRAQHGNQHELRVTAANSDRADQPPGRSVVSILSQRLKGASAHLQMIFMRETNPS